MATGDVRPAGQGGVTAAGVLLIVLGSLTLLVNGAGLLITLAEDEFLGLEGGPLLLGLTGFGVLLGIASIASGIGVLRRKGAWRVVGIVAAAVGALSALINLIGGAGAGIAIILLIAWIWAIVQLATSGRAFRPAGAPGTAGLAPTVAGGLPAEAPRAAGPLGAILALAGAALVVLAWFIPVIGSFRLFGLGLAPPEFWLWAFLEPFGLAVAAAVFAVLGLAKGDRLKSGVLVGSGSVGILFFLSHMWIILTGAPFGLGTLLGLVGAGLILGGGIAMAAGSAEVAGKGNPLGPILALVGAGVGLLAWVLPLTGGPGFLSGFPIGDYIQQTLEILGAIIAGGVAAVLGLAGRGRRFTGGLSMGAGILGALFYLGVIGFDLTQERFSAAPWLGLVGAALLVVGGAISAAAPSRMAVAPPGQFYGPSPAPPPVAPPSQVPATPPAPPVTGAIGEGPGAEDSRIRSLIGSLGSRRKTLSEPEAVSEIVELGEASVPLLIANITRSSFVPPILGKIGDSRALEPLMELAQSPARFESDPDAYGGYACEMAVIGLGLLGDQRALPLLREIARETNVGEIHMAATQAIGRLERKATGTPAELEGLSEFELERMAQSESTPANTLEVLGNDSSGRVKAVVAMNPATPEGTLRKLAERPELHANLLMNPACPPDVLSNIVRVGRAPNARYQAERHPNWKG